MKLYLAGIYTAGFTEYGTLYLRLTEAEKALRGMVRNYLESYHYVYRQSAVDKIRNDNRIVFLDSGAFSAFTKGVDVDIKAYCKYIQRNSDIILCSSVLDGIGDAQLTLDNQKRMEDLGTAPLPCFHYGEDESYLQYYIDNYEYITIGGMVPISTPQLKIWLDRIWKHYLTHPDGTPKVKVHGFGLTTISLMERYPWYSVDSSSWVQIASSGNIIIPGMGTIAVSSSSPNRHVANQHLDTIAPIQREKLENDFRELGLEPDRLRHEYLTRWVYNMWAFTRMEDLYQPSVSFKEDQIGLF